MSKSQYISHADEIKDKMQKNIEQALMVMGITAVKGVKNKINAGYYPTRKAHQAGKPTNSSIRDTSALFNDINYAVEADKKTVSIGTNMEYALYVHEGKPEKLDKSIQSINN